VKKKLESHAKQGIKAESNKMNEPDAKRIDIKSQNTPVFQTQKTPNSNNMKKSDL
jgi:hypothetical protein